MISIAGLQSTEIKRIALLLVFAAGEKNSKSSSVACIQ
jgi:hypothetical protein